MSKYRSMEEESSDEHRKRDVDAAAPLDVTEASTDCLRDLDLVTYDEPPAVQHADPMKFTPGRKEHTVTFTNINTAYRVSYDNSDTSTPDGNTNAAYQVTENGNVVKNGVVVTQPDGSRYVRTENSNVHWSDFRHPLRERHLKWYLILSIIATVFFFPTGIPAVIFARATRKQFFEGIERGNLDKARSNAKKTERLIVLSAVLALLVLVLALALFESGKNTSKITPVGTIG